MTYINFPGGAGGNWLAAMLDSETLSRVARPNWHQHDPKKNKIFRLVHRLDNNYNLLYSGSFYFNFYLNVLFKFYHIDGGFKSIAYQDRFNKMFEVARWLHDWSALHNNKRADLCFDDLITNPLVFYHKVVIIQQSHNLQCTSIDEFQLRRKLFFESCIRSDTLFENFNEMPFVIFILAWLERKGVFPHENTHFTMNDPSNKQLCIEFALDHYKLCPNIKNFIFMSGKKWIDVL